MADTPPTTGPQPTAAGPAPALQSVAHYVKDLSFENLNAPQSLVQTRETPSIQVSANLEARGMAQDMYEVELSLTVTASRQQDRVFVVEVVYGGLFRIAGQNGEQLRETCLVECPRLLFPFARRVIADATRDGGFTPLLLDPIDFASLYRERHSGAAEAAGKSAG